MRKKLIETFRSHTEDARAHLNAGLHFSFGVPEQSVKMIRFPIPAHGLLNVLFDRPLDLDYWFGEG